MISVIKSDLSITEIVKCIDTNTVLVDIRYYKRNPNAVFSPYFPIGDVPIRYSAPDTAVSLAAMMEGLRVSSSAKAINLDRFSENNYFRLKEDAKRQTIGFLRGAYGTKILSSTEAFQCLLIPTYKWILEFKLNNYITSLRKINETKKILIIEYSNKTPYDGEYTTGELLRSYILGIPPYEDVFDEVVTYICKTNHKRIYCVEKKIKRVPKPIQPLCQERTLQFE